MSVAGAVVTVNARVAGDASVLPAASVARTETLCGPSPGSPWSTGLVQSPTRRRPAALERRPSSLEVNANVGVLLLVVPVGPELIVVSGAVVSAGGAAAPP